MKKRSFFLAVCCTALFFACDSDSDPVIGGEVADQGLLGTNIPLQVLGMPNVAGTATVVSVDDNVSSYRIVATVDNEHIKNTLANFPEVEIDGNQIVVENFMVRVTTQGIEVIDGPAYPGVIVDFDAKKGDTYSMQGSSRKRKVVRRSTEDDFNWEGWLIKVIEVEEPTRIGDIHTTTYYANHRFGMVAVKYTDATNGDEYWIYF